MTNQYATSYSNLFSSMVINQDKLPEIDYAVNKINAGQARYAKIVAGTSIPWFFIGLIHYMESTCDFTRHLHNGDPLTAKTVHVPAGRPANGEPPFTFEESAADAIQYKQFNLVDKWDIPNMLYLLEAYNGFGYHNLKQPINSPYLWSYSNHYTKGKFVADGKYDPNTVSKQAGVAVIMYRVLQKNNLLASYTAAVASGAGLLVIIGIAALLMFSK